MTDRFHSLDALRAAMMLLGVFLHAACAYATLPEIWWMKDTTTSLAYDAVLLFIHVFRMPVFFVMAGFFAALLYDRRGRSGFLRHRAARIGIPLLAGWVVLYPVLRSMGAYAYYFVRRPDPWQAAKAYLFDRGGLANNTTLTHLWFLYYLLIFSVAAWALAPALDLLAQPLRRVLPHPALLALPTLLALLAMEVGALDTPNSLLPTPRILAAYGWFYLVGWVLFRNRDVLEGLPARAPLHLAAALLLSAANVWLLILQLPNRPNWDPNLRIAVAVTGASAVWYWNHGLTGWFLRHAARPHPWSRYLADSAYWLYLAHPVALVPLQIAVQPLRLPTGTKLFLVMAFSIPLLLLSYHWLVRATALGALLNGRRDPRQWPAALTAFESPCSGSAADPGSTPSPLPGRPQIAAQG